MAVVQHPYGSCECSQETEGQHSITCADNLMGARNWPESSRRHRKGAGPQALYLRRQLVAVLGQQSPGCFWVQMLLL